MGSHHQFQDIQGLASQQPASADMVFSMVFSGFAGAWRRSGAALPAVYHVMAGLVSGGPHGFCPSRGRLRLWF